MTSIQVRRHDLGQHIAPDILKLWSNDGVADYKRIAELWHLSKADLSKISDVSPASVRFDVNIPRPMAERLHELANIANLVAEFFRGDAHKVGLWFELANPMLGNISPRTMIRAGRYKRLLNFVLEAREAEQAARNAEQMAKSRPENH
ncbi:hypothetical protein HNQ60_000952 [Povalibacter uvarum]|uniref:DUF2384 domain-containing protein n=1 Tax=Povalibacter uvarum TaxID=732238 RepID=A0A841HH60_9GAMM|nr:hypothetical protein [Povalibacter uvarum]MBB6092106.1 hypothetical protein [Povalibacter uvarum]